jgi:hypothetical protein
VGGNDHRGFLQCREVEEEVSGIEMGYDRSGTRAVSTIGMLV